MKRYNVIPEETNAFMRALLKDSVFDNFKARDIDIRIFTEFKINCIKYDTEKEDEEKEKKLEYIFWHEIKEYIIGIIKGKKLPKHMKIVFAIPEDSLEKFHPNAASLFLNVVYENNEVTITTGTSQKKFEMNKNIDDTWENFVVSFFKKNSINIVEI